MNSAPILAIKFCHFSNQGDQLVKDETLVSCAESYSGLYLTVPKSIEDEVSFINEYSLIATVNHSGTLSGGHYWACIKDLYSCCWYSCNGKLVFNVEESCHQYHLIHSFLLQSVTFFQDLLQYITPQITPVLYGNWGCSLNFQAL